MEMGNAAYEIEVAAKKIQNIVSEAWKVNKRDAN